MLRPPTRQEESVRFGHSQQRLLSFHFISFHSLAAWRPLCPSKTRLSARGPRIRPGGTSHGAAHDSHPPNETSPPSRDAGLDPLLGGAESYSDPAAVLRRAVAHEGDMLRMHRLLHKVMRGAQYHMLRMHRLLHKVTGMQHHMLRMHRLLHKVTGMQHPVATCKSCMPCMTETLLGPSGNQEQHRLILSLMPPVSLPHPTLKCGLTVCAGCTSVCVRVS